MAQVLNKRTLQEDKIFDLRKRFSSLVKDTRNGIISYLLDNGLKEFDLELDQEGRNSQDENYDSDFVNDNLLYCYSSKDWLGVITKVVIDEKEKNLIVKGRAVEGEFSDAFVETSEMIALYEEIVFRVEHLKEIKDKENKN